MSLYRRAVPFLPRLICGHALRLAVKYSGGKRKKRKRNIIEDKKRLRKI